MPRFFSFLLFLLPISGVVAAQTAGVVTAQSAGKKVAKIVLDAGHGGKDVGARGKYSLEKELTLAIVKRLGKMLADSMPAIQLIYTRTTDIYPSLVDRHEVANRAAADLFISVHINAARDRTERIQTGTRTVGKGKRKRTVAVYKTIRHHETATRGTETLVIGSIRSGQKNAAMGEYGGNVVEEGLLNEDDPQTAIILAQYMSAYQVSSVRIGTYIQDEFAAQGRGDRGVHQQSLEVLAGTYMPGVLVECGFINNPEEEDYMNSEKGQLEIAGSIFRGIRAYRQSIEGM